MQRLHDLVSSLLSSPDLSSALETVLDSAISIIGANMGSIQLLVPPPTRPKLSPIGAFRLNPSNTSLLWRRRNGLLAAEPWDQGGAFWWGMSDKILIMQTIELTRRLPVIAAVQSNPLVSHGGKVLGVLSTYFAQPHVPSEREARILDLYTGKRQTLSSAAALRTTSP